MVAPGELMRPYHRRRRTHGDERLGTRHSAWGTGHSEVQLHDVSALLLVSAYGQSR
jgi:hypothetical protein